MSEETKAVVDSEIDDLEKDFEGNDDTDWKSEALKFRGMAKRYGKSHKELQEFRQAKAEKAKKAEEAPEKSPKQKEEFDYEKAAYLNSKGVPEEDHDFIFKEAGATGKSVKEVAGFRYVQDELKSRKQARQSEDATPSGGKRSSSPARDTVDYWLAKGELPPYDDFELRAKVVQAKIDRERKGRKTFTDNPIVG